MSRTFSTCLVLFIRYFLTVTLPTSNHTREGGEEEMALAFRGSDLAPSPALLLLHHEMLADLTSVSCIFYSENQG